MDTTENKKTIKFIVKKKPIKIKINKPQKIRNDIRKIYRKVDEEREKKVNDLIDKMYIDPKLAKLLFSN